MKITGSESTSEMNQGCKVLIENLYAYVKINCLYIKFSKQIMQLFYNAFLINSFAKI